MEESTLSEIVDDCVHGNVVDAHVDVSVSNTEEQHSGVFASVFLDTSSITRDEQTCLERNGLYIVEQAGHVVENSAIDESISDISYSEIRDAAEVSTELIIELDLRRAPGRVGARWFN